MNKGNMFLPTRTTHKIDTEQGKNKKKKKKEKRKKKKSFKVAVSMSQ